MKTKLQTKLEEQQKARDSRVKVREEKKNHQKKESEQDFSTENDAVEQKQKAQEWRAERKKDSEAKLEQLRKARDMKAKKRLDNAKSNVRTRVQGIENDLNINSKSQPEQGFSTVERDPVATEHQIEKDVEIKPIERHNVSLGPESENIFEPKTQKEASGSKKRKVERFDDFRPSKKGQQGESQPQKAAKRGQLPNRKCQPSANHTNQLEHLWEIWVHHALLEKANTAHAEDITGLQSEQDPSTVEKASDPVPTKKARRKKGEHIEDGSNDLKPVEKASDPVPTKKARRKKGEHIKDGSNDLKPTGRHQKDSNPRMQPGEEFSRTAVPDTEVLFENSDPGEPEQRNGKNDGSKPTKRQRKSEAEEDLESKYQEEGASGPVPAHTAKPGTKKRKLGRPADPRPPKRHRQVEPQPREATGRPPASRLPKNRKYRPSACHISEEEFKLRQEIYRLQLVIFQMQEQAKQQQKANTEHAEDTTGLAFPYKNSAYINPDIILKNQLKLVLLQGIKDQTLTVVGHFKTHPEEHGKHALVQYKGREAYMPFSTCETMMRNARTESNYEYVQSLLECLFTRVRRDPDLSTFIRVKDPDFRREKP